jgi:hypothetical protein
MTISSTSPSYQSPAAADNDLAMLALKKQQDASKSEGQALVALIASSTSSAADGHFSAYA